MTDSTTPFADGLLLLSLSVTLPSGLENRDLFDHSKDHLALKDDPVDGTIVFGATEVRPPTCV